MMHRIAATVALFMATASCTIAFTFPSCYSLCQQPRSTHLLLGAHNEKDQTSSADENIIANDASKRTNRRAFLTNIIAVTGASSSSAIISNALPAYADDDVTETSSSTFESIAARAAKVSEEVQQAEAAKEATNEAAQQRNREAAQALKNDKRTIYDFTLPINGKAREVSEVLGQTFDNGDSSDGWSDGSDGGMDYSTTLGSRVKAVLVVNIKQDDPLARKNIPELIALVTKFNKNGEFAVIVSPTDQGYYEPDTSALLRLKLEQEYGYGNAPGTILTDKVNLLGTGALPFWRWLEGSCRTPSGLGKIQANFEKFLIDGRTGKPLRRYPRKYQPYDIADDIAALIQGKPLPPAGSNFKEEWRNAAKEAENDTYRFQKGLNYFDQ